MDICQTIRQKVIESSRVIESRAIYTGRQPLALPSTYFKFFESLARFFKFLLLMFKQVLFNFLLAQPNLRIFV